MTKCKPCEWAYEDFETCDEVEDNNDWECDPRKGDCGGIYEWGPFEKELEGTTDFPTTTAASEASDEKWEQLGDLIEIAANNSLTEKSSTSSTTSTTERITTTSITTTTGKMSVAKPTEILTTAPTTQKTTTTPESTTAIETTITLQAEKIQEKSKDAPLEKEESKIQYLKDSLEDSPGVGQFLISMGKPGESGSVINSFHISPVMTNNVETHNNGGESSKLEQSKFEPEPYSSGSVAKFNSFLFPA